MTTARTRITRLREKNRSERAELDAILDSVHVGHFGLTGSDGEPRVMPTAVARDGDEVLIHGSTGSPWLQLLGDGVPTCLTVTAFDGLVVARSAFESSIHYRSATLFGRCRSLTGAAKLVALDLVTEALLPGRVDEIRRPSERELAATMVLALPIIEWSVKVSAGWPDDPDEDVAGDAWAGVIPRQTSYGVPTAAPDLRGTIAVPESVARLCATDAVASRAP